MKSVMKHTKKDDAVSPVVGVMLMLVVTIIIAAVVAAFAGGIATEKEAAPFANINLETYSMETHGGNFAPYSMVFKHTGGEEILTKDLSLSITFNAATYTTPISAVSTKEAWTVGEKLTLVADPDSSSSLKYGLSQQGMNYGPGSFDWALLFKGNVIAKGTALKSKHVVAPAGTLSLSFTPNTITSGDSVTFTITATGLDGETVTVSAWSKATVGGTNSATITDGTATITAPVTLTNAEEAAEVYFHADANGIQSTEMDMLTVNPAGSP